MVLCHRRFAVMDDFFCCCCLIFYGQVKSPKGMGQISIFFPFRTLQLKFLVGAVGRGVEMQLGSRNFGEGVILLKGISQVLPP